MRPVDRTGFELLHRLKSLPIPPPGIAPLNTPDHCLPFGAIVATADLWASNSTDDPGRIASLCQTYRLNHAVEQICGNFTRGRYAWFLRDIHRLASPISRKGHQGFFWVDLPEP
jgi:hypothetical protein